MAHGKAYKSEMTHKTIKERRNIIVDLGGVLTGLDRLRCIEAFKNIGAGAIAGYVDECRQEDFFHDLEVGNTDTGEFCEAVRRACQGCDATDEAVCDAWNALLTGIPQHRLDMLLELKRDHRLVLLSNTNPIHWHKAEAEYFSAGGHAVSDYFEQVFLSYRMHLVKPDEEIFRRVLRETGFAPSDTLFIDDSAANRAAAMRLGIAAVAELEAVACLEYT